MKLKPIFLFLILTLFFIACNQDEDEAITATNTTPDNFEGVLNDDGYLIFGWFYGECLGETCIEIYQVSNESLLEDENDNYPSWDEFYNADFYPISINPQIIVPTLEPEPFLELVKDFPTDLFNVSETVIGMPDAGDWGGLYIELQLEENGYRQFWLIDQMQDNVPEYLHDYINKVNSKIAILSHN